MKGKGAALPGRLQRSQEARADPMPEVCRMQLMHKMVAGDGEAQELTLTHTHVQGEITPAKVLVERMVVWIVVVHVGAFQCDHLPPE